MPAKPRWFHKIEELTRHFELHPQEFVDRATLEFLLGIGRRRAQQLMAPCVTQRVGANGFADRKLLIERLRRLAESEDAYYERRRRRRVATVLEELRRDRLERPQLLVEAPLRVMDQEMSDLPAGVQIAPGRITVDFEDPRQALEKLLALAMAISNDFDRFDRCASK